MLFQINELFLKIWSSFRVQSIYLPPRFHFNQSEIANVSEYLKKIEKKMQLLIKRLILFMKSHISYPHLYVASRPQWKHFSPSSKSLWQVITAFSKLFSIYKIHTLINFYFFVFLLITLYFIFIIAHNLIIFVNYKDLYEEKWKWRYK